MKENKCIDFIKMSHIDHVKTATGKTNEIHDCFICFTDSNQWSATIVLICLKDAILENFIWCVLTDI